MEFRVMKGSTILSRHKTRKEAGRSMGRLLFNNNNLSLVEVRGNKAVRSMVNKGKRLGFNL